MPLRGLLHLLELLWLALLNPGAQRLAQWLSLLQIPGQGTVREGQWRVLLLLWFRKHCYLLPSAAHPNIIFSQLLPFLP